MYVFLLILSSIILVSVGSLGGLVLRACCSARNFLTYIPTDIDRPFAPFECNMIRHLYQKYGPRWRRMSAVLHRPPQMIMDCWLSLEAMDDEIRKQMSVQRLLS